jgi:hypothetical protein
MITGDGGNELRILKDIPGVDRARGQIPSEIKGAGKYTDAVEIGYGKGKGDVPPQLAIIGADRVA